MDGSAGFVISIVSGILLAMGFQILLTNLLIALGITLSGNIEEKAEEGAQREPGKTPGRAMIKISTGAGVAALLSLTASLFAASYLGVQLSLAAGARYGMTLGLVIWAGYFLAMLFFEMKAVSTFMGGIARTAIHALRGTFRITSGMLAPSPASLMKKSVAAFREELENTLEDDSFKDKVGGFFKQLKPKDLDLDKVTSDLTDMLKGLAVKEGISREDGETTRYFQIVERHPRLNKENAQKIKGVLEKVVGGAPTAGGGYGLAGDGDANKLWEKIENYVRNSGLEHLEPEQLKKDLDKIVHEPAASKEVLLNRLKQVDPSKLVAAVTGRKDIPEIDKGKIAETVKKTINSLKETAAAQKEQIVEKGREAASNAKSEIEQRLHAYLDSLAEPDLSFDEIKSDFEKIVHDPKAAPHILKQRFQKLDRDSLVAVLSSNPHIPREKAEHFIAGIEATRDKMIQKAEAIEASARAKAEQARHAALHQAEIARKAAAVAAWWFFACGAVSAAAAAYAGALAAA